MTKAKEVIYLTIGSTLLSAGIYFFKLPNDFVTGRWQRTVEIF